MKTQSIKTLKKKIIHTGRQLYEKNLISATDGNISLRFSDHQILITPSGKSKANLKAHDFAMIDLQGKTLHGTPSSESLMHLEIYRHCSNAKAIIHAHPPTAIAWSIAFPNSQEIPKEYCSELILALGHIPIVPYARPGTIEMGKALLSFLPHSRVLLLEKHGALSWGEDIEEAYFGMERLEQVCQILKSAMELEKNQKLWKALPTNEINALKKIKKQRGERIL